MRQFSASCDLVLNAVLVLNAEIRILHTHAKNANNTFAGTIEYRAQER